MKLRLLIKFEQIKVLEDYYNRHHSYAFENQIHLDIELDDEQLRQIVVQLYSKHQKSVKDEMMSDHDDKGYN